MVSGTIDADLLDYLARDAHYTGLDHLWLPRTVLESDFLVSMPKVKTHHWAGVTLSMKNMFGIVPGTRYGWPKNILHWHGIHNSVLDICATVPIHLVIADAIICMEGNGPLHGTRRRLNKVVIADDPVAADATCAGLLGFAPDQISHIRKGGRFIGNASTSAIVQQSDQTPIGVPFEASTEFRIPGELRSQGGLK